MFSPNMENIMRLLPAICFAFSVGYFGAAQADDVSLRAISQCWDVGSTSKDTLSSIVVLEVKLRTNGSAESVSMISGDGPSEASVRSAYEIARRAVMRCAKNGAPWPAQTITLKFDYKALRVEFHNVTSFHPIDI